MVWRYYVADRDTPAVPLWDFTDATGVVNPGGVTCRMRGIDKGSFTPDRTVFQSDVGYRARTTRLQLPPVAMTIQLRTSAPSHDAHRLGIGRLLWLLQADRVIVGQPEGATDTEYIYTIGADVTQLFRGGIQNLDWLIAKLQDPDGYDLVIEREAVIRSAELDPAVNVIRNPFMLLDLDLSARADDWTWSSTSNITAEFIDATKGKFSFTIATAATRDLRQNGLAASAAPGQVWAFSLYAETDALDAGARGRAVVEYLDNTGTPIAAAQTLGALVVLGAAEQRLTVVGGVAPAGTDRVRAYLQMNNTNGTARVVRVGRAQLELNAVTRFRAGVQAIGMSWGGTTNPWRVIPLWNDGHVPTPFRLQGKMDGSASTVELLFARRGNDGVAGKRRLADLLNGPTWVPMDATAFGWTIALGVDTTDVGTEARTTHVTDPTRFQRHVRATRTTLLDGMRGVMDVWWRGKATAVSEHELLLKWGPSLLDPAPVANDKDVASHLVPTGTTAFGFVELYLGRIALPVSPGVALGGVALELWSRRISGSGNLDTNALWLVPADVTLDDAQGGIFVRGGSSVVYTPGLGGFIDAPFTNPSGFTAGSLQVIGGSPDPVYVLDALNQGGGTSPAAGVAAVVGRHDVTWRLFSDAFGGFGGMTVRLAVRNITDNADAGFIDLVVPAGNGLGDVDVTVRYDAVAGKSYQLQARVTSYTASGGYGVVYVLDATDRFGYVLGANESFRSDPGDRYAIDRLDSSGNYVTDLEGGDGVVPMTLGPGLSLLFARALEKPLAGYSEPASDLARVITLSAYHSPGLLV